MPRPIISTHALATPVGGKATVTIYQPSAADIHNYRENSRANEAVETSQKHAIH
jgi:hypothetical protein